MRQHRIDLLPVINDYRVPGEIEIARRDDLSGIWCLDRCAGATEKIRAGVRTAELPVELAASAKAAVGFAGHRPDERTVPQRLWSGNRVHGLEKRALGVDPLLRRSRR